MQTAAEHFEAGVPGLPGGIPVFYGGADDDDESVRRLSALELQESKSWPSIDVHVEEERPASPPAGSALVFSPREVMFGEVFGLGRAVVAGVTSLAVLEAHFYLSGGCSAARWAPRCARRFRTTCAARSTGTSARRARADGDPRAARRAGVRRRRDALGPPAAARRRRARRPSRCCSRSPPSGWCSSPSSNVLAAGLARSADLFPSSAAPCAAVVLGARGAASFIRGVVRARRRPRSCSRGSASSSSGTRSPPSGSPSRASRRAAWVQLGPVSSGERAPIPDGGNRARRDWTRPGQWRIWAGGDGAETPSMIGPARPAGARSPGARPRRWGAVHPDGHGQGLS